MQMEEFEKEGATKNELAVISDKLLGIDKLRTDTAKEQIKLDYESYQITAKEADVRRMMADTQFRDNQEVQQAIKARADMNEKEQTTLDILRYQIDIKKLDIEYQEKRHMISQRDADVQKMILADRRAQDELMNNPKGGPIVQQIIALADAMQKLRMAEITHVGLFSGAYSPGRVNFRALNQNRPYGALQGPGQFTDKYTAATNVTGLNKDFQSPLNKLYSQPLPVILSGGLPPGAVPAASPAGGTSQTDAAQDAKKTTKKIKMNAAQLDWLAQDKILNPKETHPKYDESGNLISGTPLKYHTTHTVGGEGWVPTPMNELMDNARGGKKDSVDHDAAQTSLLTTIAAHLGIIVQNGGLN